MCTTKLFETKDKLNGVIHHPSFFFLFFFFFFFFLEFQPMASGSDDGSLLLDQDTN